MRRDVFQAIADPIRRDIIELIANQPMPINAIAQNFQISRPAVSKHIKILNECGVIAITKNGRERFCEIQAKSLIPVTDWVGQYRNLWEDKLDSFSDYLNQLKLKNEIND